MPKAGVSYVCADCGGKQRKWSGQCPDCGVWNSLQETVESPSTGVARRFAGYTGSAEGAVIHRLSEVSAAQEARVGTGLSELDRVLGGGLVAGSVVLIGGDPGIGKSTILLQALSALADRLSALYVSGEESPQQVSLRASRLALDRDRLRLLAETCVERVLAMVTREQPKLLVIDSIQTLFSEALQSAPGSVAQVRECAAQLVRYAKQTGTTVLLVGHVTKDGQIAGPRVLEHMVDTVIYFEGESGSRFRAMRAVKNRFGPVNELGVFAMTDKGLRMVSNPSAIFLSRHDEPVAGSVVMVTREGTRPLLVEIQVLVDESPVGNPRRIAVGLEQNRLSILLAVLHKHAGLAMFGHDVYANAVGGVKIAEPAADLALLMAVMSSFRNRPLPSSQVVFGEVGLSGEIRPVPGGEERLREAVKHGFESAIVAKANAPRKNAIPGLRVQPLSRISQALDLI